MLNAIDDGVYFLDPLGNTVFVNEAAARLLGHTAREMLGKPQHELIHHHYPDGTVFPREACPIYLSATEGIPQRVGGDVFWRKDGTPLHVDYTSIPIRERRQIVGVVVTFRDISAQQRAEEQEARLTKERAARAEAERARQSLLVSDQRYRALVEAAGQYVWTNSPEGRMEGEQPGWSALTGQSSAEYEGFGWSNAVHPDDVGPTVEAWNRSVATRSVFSFEHRVRAADGEYRLFSIRAVPILNADGTIREWVGAHWERIPTSPTSARRSSKRNMRAQSWVACSTRHPPPSPRWMLRRWSIAARMRGIERSSVDKGIDRTAARADLEGHFDEPHTLTLLCSGSNDAPAPTVQFLLNRAREAGVRDLKSRTAMLVLPKTGEALAVKDESGNRVETVEDGSSCSPNPACRGPA